MFEKDTLRLIGKTFKRFFSLVMIVLIGSSFMMGLLSTRRIMEQSVDRYNDALDLQDVQIYSSYGFDGKDTSAIRGQEWAEHIFASRMRDIFSRDSSGEVSVTRVEESDRAVNRFELVEGRMPEKEDEVLILNNTLYANSYGVGSTLELFLDDSDVLDIFTTDKVTVVGVVRSPAYMAKTLGTSLLKNLDLQIVLYAQPSIFKSEYYTTVYVTVPEARELDGYGREYADLMDQVKTDIDVFSRKQSQQLKDRLVSEYTEEIEKNEAELEEKRAEAQQELDDAKTKLDDANIQLIAGQSQLDSLKLVLKQGEDRLALLKNSYIGEYSDVDADIAAVEAEYGKPFDEVYSDVTNDYGTYTALRTMSDSSGSDVLDQRISETEASIAASRSLLNDELYPRRAELQEILADPDSTEEQRVMAATELTSVEQSISEAEDRLSLNERLLEGLLEMKDAEDSNSASSRMAEIDAKYNGSVESEYQRMTRLSRDRVAWNTIRDEVRIAEDAVENVRKQISDLEYELETGKAEYEEGLAEYQKGLIEFTEQMEKAEAEIRKAYQELEELPGASWTILDRDRHYTSYMFSNNSKQMGAIGIAMPVMFFLVAALVCLTTMTRLIDEQRGQIGIFRALGFSRARVISKYVFYALLASTIGATAGLAAGMAVFPTVIYRTWRLLYDLPEMIVGFPVINALIVFFSFAALMAGVTALVVNRTLRETPSQLMRPKAPKAAKKVFLEYIPILWKRLSFTGKITARNIIRYKARFFMTVIGVAGCTALLVLGWGIKDSIKDVVNVQYGDITAYQYMVNLENDHALNDILEALQSDLDNEYVVPYLRYSTKMYLEDGREEVLEAQVIDARESQDIYRFRSASDHLTPLRLGNSGAVLTEKFATSHGIKEGDYVTIESLNGIKEQVKVAAVCEMYFQHYIYISQEMYESLFGEPVHFNTIAVRSSAGLEEIDDEISDMEGFMSAIDFNSVIDNFNTMISALDLIIVVIILTAGALAFVVLINLTQVNISERLREIATLKVLGFRQIEVQSYLFKEIFLLSVIGALIGLPLGIVFHHFIMNVISMDMVMFGMVIKAHSYIYAFAVTIVFSLIVLVLTIPSLKKIEMIESLKSVE